MIYRTGDEIIKEFHDYIKYLQHTIDTLQKKNIEYKEQLEKLQKDYDYMKCKWDKNNE